MAARPERVGRLSARRRDSRRCRSRRSRRSPRTPRSGTRRRSSCSTIWRPSSASCSPITASARCPTPCARGRCRFRTGSAADRARAGRQGRVRPRLRAVPWRPGPVDAAGRRWFASTTSRASVRVRWTRSHRRAGRSRRVRRSSRATPGPTRSRCRTGRRIRRTSSDPGRALLTGFAGVGPAPQDDWNKLDVPSLRGLRKTAPYFHNNSAATLEAVVDHYIEFFKRGRRERSGRSRGAHPEHRRRARRSPTDARGAPAADRLSEDAVAHPRSTAAAQNRSSWPLRRKASTRSFGPLERDAGAGARGPEQRRDQLGVRAFAGHARPEPRVVHLAAADVVDAAQHVRAPIGEVVARASRRTDPSPRRAGAASMKPAKRAPACAAAGQDRRHLVVGQAGDDRRDHDADRDAGRGQRARSRRAAASGVDVRGSIARRERLGSSVVTESATRRR